MGRPLSPHTTRVLELLAEGKSYREIAKLTGFSYSSVNSVANRHAPERRRKRPINNIQLPPLRYATNDTALIDTWAARKERRMEEKRLGLPFRALEPKQEPAL